MKGQMKFDEFMRISEEGTQQEDIGQRPIKQRPQMVDPCYYCLCNSCVNNIYNFNVKSAEIPYDQKQMPCLTCEDCGIYDGDKAKGIMEREQCYRYKIDNYHAERNRKKIRIVKGFSGGGNGAIDN